MGEIAKKTAAGLRARWRAWAAAARAARLADPAKMLAWLRQPGVRRTMTAKGHARRVAEAEAALAAKTKAKTAKKA
jgi:hypothetical protein